MSKTINQIKIGNPLYDTAICPNCKKRELNSTFKGGMPIGLADFICRNCYSIFKEKWIKQ